MANIAHASEPGAVGEVTPPPTLSESQTRLPRGWSVYLDNDIFYPKFTDQDYTGGFSINITDNEVRQYWLSPDQMLGWLDALLPLERAAAPRLYSLDSGITVFTPENIEASDPLPGDRPYASLVFVSANRAYAEPGASRAWMSTLTLGVLGLRASAIIQEALHRMVHTDKPMGWDHQISDGGEFTLRYSLASQKMHRRGALGPESWQYEVKTTKSLSIGYLTDTAWGVSLRYGHLHSPWWAFNPQHTEYGEQATQPGLILPKGVAEYYVWGGFNIRLRAYNAFLEGQFRNSDVSFDRSELRYLIGEAWLGVTHEFEKGWRASYFLRGQTSEIKSGPASRATLWGGVIFGSVY